MELRDLVINYRPTNLEDCADGKRTSKVIDEIFKVSQALQSMGYDL